MADTYYPPGGFYFSVTVLGAGAAVAAFTDVDASFQEISGIKSEFDIEPVTEGGENRFVHQLPKAAKYSNLVLKRGAVSIDSFLNEWVGLTVGANMSLPIVTQNLLVSLLDDSGLPSIAWIFVNAYPVRWEIGNMDSQQNQVLTESLEFAYNYFERINLGGGLSAAVKLGQATAKYAL